MTQANYGVCEKCKELVPMTREIRDGKAYLNKQCPKCGPTTALISSDAATWQAKQELCGFNPDKADHCDLRCTSCNRQGAHGPRLAFLDITNNCNMNCPICIANIHKMGFVFNPPLEYFDRVMTGLTKMDPKPEVLLFGGEPTVRKDMFEIIKMGQDKGLEMAVVTNGLRLADEEFCKKLCETNARVLIAFDGRSPEIYTRLRKAGDAYEKKIKALANLKKYSKRKNTIMCCAARGINDQYMRDLVDFCHENRSIINKLHMIPLTETWEKGEFDVAQTTTIEDVEQMMNEAFPGEPVGFVPLGLAAEFTPLTSFFGKPRSTFSGVHPNCESITIFVSDGQRFRPLSHFLKRPFNEAVTELMTLVHKAKKGVAHLDPRVPKDRRKGQLYLIRTFLGYLYRTINAKTFLKGNSLLTTAKFIGGLLAGKSIKEQLWKHTNYGESLDMIVLPFEEEGSLESARVYRCKAAFAYEDPDDAQIKTVPVCAWWLVRGTMEKKIAEKYARRPEQAATEPVGAN